MKYKIKYLNQQGGAWSPPTQQGGVLTDDDIKIIKNLLDPATTRIDDLVKDLKTYLESNKDRNNINEATNWVLDKKDNIIYQIDGKEGDEGNEGNEGDEGNEDDEGEQGDEGNEGEQEGVEGNEGEQDDDFNITINPLNIEVKDSRITTMISSSIKRPNGTDTKNLKAYIDTNGENIWKTMKDGIFNGDNHGDRMILQGESYDGVHYLFKYMKNINRKPESLSNDEFDTLKTMFRNINPPIIGETREENKTRYRVNYNKLSIAFNLGYFINLLEEGSLEKYNFNVRYTRGDGFCGWRSILSVIRKKNGTEDNYDYIDDPEFTQEYKDFLKALPNTIKEIIDLGLNWEIFNETTLTAEDLEYKEEHIKIILDKFNDPLALDDIAMQFIVYYYKINLYVLKINNGGTREGDQKIDLNTRFQTILGITSFEPRQTLDNIIIFHSGSHYTPVISGNNTDEFWTNTEIENIKSIFNKPINYITDIITACNNNI